MAKGGVGFIQPRCQADPAWNAVDLGYGVAFRGEDEVGSNDTRDVAGNAVVALKSDEFWWFSCIEQISDPGGLATFCTLAIELVASF